MTKKDFEAIAWVIWKHRIAKKHPLFMVDIIAVFKKANPLFNAAKFLEACRHEK